MADWVSGKVKGSTLDGRLGSVYTCGRLLFIRLPPGTVKLGLEIDGERVQRAYVNAPAIPTRVLLIPS